MAVGIRSIKVNTQIDFLAVRLHKFDLQNYGI